MALPQDFLHHLHELMVEVADSVRDEEAEYKQKLIFDAQQTHNSAAMPLAYRDAALHAFRNRTEGTIDKCIEALEIWKISLDDDDTEREMLAQIGQLLAAPRQLSFPPRSEAQPKSSTRSIFL